MWDPEQELARMNAELESLRDTVVQFQYDQIALRHDFIELQFDYAKLKQEVAEIKKQIARIREAEPHDDD